MSWAVAVCVDLTCVMAARERQRDKQAGIPAKRLSWPTVVLAGGVLLSLAANLAQAQPTAWGRIVAAVTPAAFLVAVSMIERRAGRRPRLIAGEDGSVGEPSAPGRPSPLPAACPHWPSLVRGGQAGRRVVARAAARQAPRRRGNLPGRARRPRAGRLATSAPLARSADCPLSARRASAGCPGAGRGTVSRISRPFSRFANL
jgi:hypothetical protein